MSGVIVTMRHVRLAGLCAPGLRRWFAPHDRGLLRRFCREGLPVEMVEGFGDPFSLKVAQYARREAIDG